VHAAPTPEVDWSLPQAQHGKTTQASATGPASSRAASFAMAVRDGRVTSASLACSRHPAEGVAPAVAEVPQLAQNFAPAAISTPQPLQNFFWATRGEPQSAQNFPPGCLAPHFPQATCVPPGENVGACAAAGGTKPPAIALPMPTPIAIYAPSPATPPLPTPCAAMPCPAPMTA
jgi:hypothetical protein